MRLHNPAEKSNWIECNNPFHKPIHYFDRVDTRINYSIGYCDECWYWLLRQENYKPPVITSPDIIHKKSIDCRPEKDSL